MDIALYDVPFRAVGSERFARRLFNFDERGVVEPGLFKAKSLSTCTCADFN